MNGNTFFAVRNQAKLQKMSAGNTPVYEWWGSHSGHPNGPEAMQFPHFLDTPVTVGSYMLGTAKHPDSTKRLPAPDAGDIFFDFEGFPFHPSGALEYLFGWVSIQDGTPVFDFLWADTEKEEKSAFEKFVTFLLHHFHKFPNAHVYHYAPYEVTALRRLANKYGVFRDETHTLIDGGKFVDLYAVVKQSLQIGVGSYSIKKIEPMFGFHPRTADVASAMASVQVYDSYVKKCETNEGEAQLLKNSILEYNEDDCVSTYVLFRWLNSHRDEALAHVPQTVLDKVPYESSQKNVDTRQRCVSLKEQLKQVGTAQALMLVDCVDYYISEEGVQYFSQFDQLNNPTVDTCVLTGMDVVAAGPRTNSRSAVMLHHTGKLNVKNTFTILSASHFVGAEQVSSSVVEEKFGVRVTPEPGQFLALLNAKKAADAITEHAVCVDGVVRAGAKQEALFALCDDVVAGKNIGVAGALLSKCTGVTLPHGSNVDDNIAQATAMLTPGTYFAVQGPPGAGKTYMGVAVVQEALQLGYSVGVCSVSHKAVENLLTGLVKKDIPVVKHSTAKPDPDAKFSQMRIDIWVEDPSVGVCGGTVFAFAALGKKPDMAHMVDLLVIDEASQMSVVDALAAVRCAKRVVLLGDPAQLPHVAQATHEGVAQHSILGHLVSGHTIMPDSQGYFLPTTFRFGPDLAVPVSQLAYEGKLSSAVPQRHVDTLAGVYRKFVPSVGCEQSNVVEAHTCADIVTTLVGSPCGDAELAQEDIVVVAPYNDVVRLVKDTFAENGLSQVRVGTVDSFQGQQCLVVLFALTASSDVGGRGASFVLDVARLNVSLSRAVAVAVVVGAPDVASGVSLSVDGLNVAATCAFVDSLPVLPDIGI